MKTWGKSEFWGVGTEYDPDWLLTDSQKKLQKDLIEVCRTKLRPHAIHCDKNYVFPKENIDAIAELGLLGLIIPKEMGGMGENQVCMAMVAETIARYGCPSTAMIFTMHTGSVSTLLFRHHNNSHIQNLLKRIPKERLLGAASASDPATGSHDWFPLSSKVKNLDDNKVQLLKFGSWVTSAGYADFYSLLTVSPEMKKDNYSQLAFFLVYKEEIRASCNDWSALGMHGNMSGPMIAEGTFNKERMMGSAEDGRKVMEECIDSVFLIMTSSCWNGIALGCIDLAKKHVTKSAHADVGLRVCDYPVIQDYVGESIIDTNSSRTTTFLMAQTLDKDTNNNDYSLHSDVNFIPRTGKIHWLWQIKFTAAKNVSAVADRMLQATGGTGYKTELGLERLLRDGKAGWVMAPSNEILRNLIGFSALVGFDKIDLWEERTDAKMLHRELKKMSPEEKAKLGQRLLDEASQELNGAVATHPYQDTDFINPFNTAPPSALGQDIKTSDGVTHNAALKTGEWLPLSLASKSNISDDTTSFVFSLPKKTDHTGCCPGQYIAARVQINNKEHTRYFSPVSCPDDFGSIELILRYETQGIVSTYFRNMQQGDVIEFQGPCGGFEYEANKFDELTILASGAGVTPGLQLIRSAVKNPNDQTKLTLLYFAEKVNDFLYHKELDSYADKNAKVKVVYTVLEASEGWEGEEGFIDTELIDKHVTKPNGKKHKIVICGGPTMSMSCLHSLKSLGYSSDSAFIYGQFGVEQIKAVFGRNVPLSGHN